MKKALLFFLLLWVCQQEAFAQQDPMYTQYMFNQLVINPAYTGSKDQVDAVLLYRTQWVGFDGAPETTSLSVHSPIFGKSSNIGVSFVHDQIGISENYYITGYYAYRIDFDKFRLSMGINAEFKRQQMRWELTNPLDFGDLAIPATADNINIPNFGAGVYLDADRFYLGIATPRLLQNDLDYTNGQPSVASSAQQKRHIYLMGGFIMDISRDVKFKPSTAIRYTNNAPLSIDINASFLFADRVWAGATWRNGDSFDIIAQLMLGKFRIGYSFDYTTTQLNAYNQGTHEIMIGLGIENRSKGIHHPRYF